MSELRVTTYQDLVDHLSDYVGSATGDDTIRYCRRSVQDAYNHFPSVHNWSYLYNRGRVTTVSPITTGTIQYINATYTVILTGNVWPSWVTLGVLVINNIPYPI